MSGFLKKTDTIELMTFAELSGLDEVTTNSASYLPVKNMSFITPSTGSYKLEFSSSGSGQAGVSGQDAEYGIFIDGVLVKNSHRDFIWSSLVGSNDTRVALHSQAIYDLLVGQEVSVRWRTSSDTFTMNERSLLITGINVYSQKALNAGPDINKMDTDINFSTFSPEGGGSGVYTYASSDNNIATIDANGDIDVLKDGTTTITVTSVAGSIYIADVSDEYILLVQKKNNLTSSLPTQSTFARTTTADVVDFEGLTKTAKINEPRFTGTRRVENLVVSPVTPATQTISLIAGNEYQARIGDSSTNGAKVDFTGAFTKTLTADGTNSLSFVDGIPIKVNKGLDFDGVNDYIGASTQVDVDTNDIEIEATIKLNSLISNQIFGDYGNGQGFYFGTSGDKLQVTLMKDGNSAISGSATLQTGISYKVKVVATRSGNMELFLNDVPDGSIDISSKAALSIITGAKPLVGKNPYGSYFDGTMKDFSLKIDGIEKLKYDLNETSGTTATDTSGNGNDGTLQNGFTFTGGSVDLTATITGNIENLQIEDVTGQANKKPSEFVDGTKSFEVENDNTVDASGIIAESTGASINEATLRGLLIDSTDEDNLTYSFGAGNISQSFALSMEVTPTLATYADDKVRLFSTQDISTIGGANYGYDNTTKTFTIKNDVIELVQNTKTKFEFILKQIGSDIQAIIKRDDHIEYDNTTAGTLSHSADGKLYIGKVGTDYFTGNFKNVLFTAE